jgi:5'-nucleotidase
MHGDFLAETRGEVGTLTGGVARLSGYLNKVRAEEKNVIFVIAGDMVQGSMIDAESRGISTMEIMNYLAPDVASIGNHELDYGLPHLLFLEKMATFPIVSANLYVKKYNKRLMNPYAIVHIDGLDVMFIGIVNEEALRTLKRDRSIGALIEMQDAVAEVGKICNAYKDDDIDLTVLLTHIGFEGDKKLASMLDPAWGVDLIIGGHSHTFLEQPEVVNNVLIAQAGVGTDQIGRFDLVVDDDTNSITEWRWQLLPIDATLAEPDPALETLVASFQDQVDRKYNRLVCRLARQLRTLRRQDESELGNLFADLFAEKSGVDVALVAHGALRGKELGPIVTLGDLRQVYPYDNALLKFRVTGATLRKMFAWMMRNENMANETGSWFQVNQGVRAVYDSARDALESLMVRGEPVVDEREYTLLSDDYRYENTQPLFGIPREALTHLGAHKVFATSCHDVIDEYFDHHQNLDRHVEGRWVYK